MKPVLPVLISLLAACALPVAAQTPCPQASEVGQAELVGTWRAEVDGLVPAGTLVLQKHPTYADTVSGSIERQGQRLRVAGDVEDGELTLEESADGVHIAAAWLGEVVEGSCGREIRGTWTPDGQEAGRPFVLRKQ